MEINDILKCNVCGNIVELVEKGGGEIVCCGQAMEILDASQKEEGREKHIPVLTIEDDKVIVDVGSIPHPMVDEHWINFVEICVGDQLYRENLNPGDEPSVTFNVASKGEKVEARIYCNVHGLWPSN